MNNSDRPKMYIFLAWLCCNADADFVVVLF